MVSTYYWSSTTAHLRRRVLAVCLAAIASLLFCVPSASADPVGDHEWVEEKYSPCMYLWTSDRYGGFARAAFHYKMYNTSSKRAYLEYGKVTVDGLMSCGPAGTPLKAAAIRLHISLRLRGSNLSCGISAAVPISLGWNCAISGGDAVYFKTVTCSPNRSSCGWEARGGWSFTANTGQSFSDYRELQVVVDLVRNTGHESTFVIDEL